MTVIIQKKSVLICAAFFLLLLWNTDVLAQGFNHIGIASMRVIQTGNQNWDLNFLDIAKFGYFSKYTAYRQVAAKLQQRSISPKVLVNPKTQKPLLPANKEAVKKFHDNVDAEFTKFLRNIALSNNTRIIIFDNIEEHHARRFINGEQKLLLYVMVYYLDSNSIGMVFVPLDRKNFRDLERLKRQIHVAVIKAMEEAIVSTAGLLTSAEDVPSSDAPSSTGSGDAGFWD